ncbi:hypothetical protein FB45DRAFT_1009663 [Roridomyces roridus]|uniref:Uncharacterized protein n=1 Tax=Roridomyces roridus TaxID=1738132 RepID=A0AAD7B630_9AGAR|nr:hypothetical protein FB45DRAFT_1009663 [Roridomyces roridus]
MVPAAGPAQNLHCWPYEHHKLAESWKRFSPSYMQVTQSHTGEQQEKAVQLLVTREYSQKLLTNTQILAINTRASASMVFPTSASTHTRECILVPESHLPMESTDRRGYLLSCALGIIHKTESLRLEFTHFLLERGIVTALVTLLCKISSHSVPNDEDALGCGMQMLMLEVFQPRCQIWFVECLRAGFLRLVASALEHPHLLSADYFKTGVLQSCTLFLPYRSVLLQFPSALADMHTHMDSTVARQSPVWEAWEQLTHWYEYFAWMLEVHDSVDRITLRGCNNVEPVNGNLLIQLEAMKRAPEPESEIFTIMEGEEGYFRVVSDFALPGKPLPHMNGDALLGPMWED